jgi:asparagine synthase (glutamine-hydrolysing)
MCGIWILIKNNPIIDSKTITSSNNIKNRGPDSTSIHVDTNYMAVFHRLAINDLSVEGNQPFFMATNTHNYVLLANGEIYNHKDLEVKYNIKHKSSSDCAFLLPFFIKLENDYKDYKSTFDIFNNELRGEYAIVIIKQEKSSNKIEYFMSTDPLSVRPLFYYFNSDNRSDNTSDNRSDKYEIGISSLLSGLSEHSNNVYRLEQGCYIHGSTDFETYFLTDKVKYKSIPNIKYINENLNLYEKIVDTLEQSVKLRLESDRPIGCLLSGGLDSSLIAAIASNELKKIGKKLKTFSIGMEGGTDLEHARNVAKHIDSEHSEFLFTSNDGLECIEDVIKVTETYDITTIRASVGQYLIAKKISYSSDIKVILNGDGADECEMGYLYFYLAPDINSAYLERNKLLDKIHEFDGLRVDRNISYHGLEARVPFLDKNFVDLYYEIDPSLLVPTKERMEKYLIRKAFEIVRPNILPKEVLWRKKEAFSDGVSSKEKSWYMIVKEHYNNLVSDSEFDKRFSIYNYNIPLCKESFYYRKKFNELYGENQRVISRYWLANWSSSKDPSARTLNINS